MGDNEDEIILRRIFFSNNYMGLKGAGYFKNGQRRGGMTSVSKTGDKLMVVEDKQSVGRMGESRGKRKYNNDGLCRCYGLSYL